jgi:RimJ/RimL family protein N-acetyltransferase
MIGLHRRIGPRAIEIGYWTHVAHAGRGYMTAAAKAITDVAEALDNVDRVEIHTDEANVRSAAIPPKLGYRLDRVDTRRPEAPAESGRLQIWVRP